MGVKEKDRTPSPTPPIKGGKVPSPFVGEGVGDEYFVSSIMVLLDKDMKIPF